MKSLSRTLAFPAMFLPGAAAIVFALSSFFFLSVCTAADGNCDIAVVDGPIVVYTTGSTVYVSNNASNKLSIIDADTNAVTDTVTVGTFPFGIVAVGTGVYVANEGTDNVSILDNRTNTVVKTVSVGDRPYRVAASGTGVYVANQDADTVSIIDVRTNTVVKTVSVGEYPNAFVVSGTGVYVINAEDNNVSIIDVRTNTVVKTLSVGGLPIEGAASGTGIFITNNGTSTVSFIDNRTNTVVASVSVDSQPSEIVVNGAKVYVASTGDQTVSAINIASRTVVASVLVGNYPRDLGASGTGVYATIYNTESVAVIDTDTDTKIADIDVGDTPYPIAFAGNFGYVGNYADDDVSVFSAVTNEALTQCTAECGNDEIGDDEACDDGNTSNGDGCSASCTIESGFTCTSEPSVCSQSCSEGVAPGSHTSKRYGNSCFAYYSSNLNFENASIGCEVHGGTLAVVDSAAVQTLLASIAGWTWIGLSDIETEGTYVWEDGTSLDYENWADGQPNGGAENCIRFENGNLWHDYPCGDAYPYFCEFPDRGTTASVTASTARSQLNGGLRPDSLQSKISSVMSQKKPATPRRTAPLFSSATSNEMTPVPAADPFRARTCSRVMKWFANHETILGRVNARLLKSFGFTCGG